MLIRSHRFEFDAPEGWPAEQERGRLVLRGPQGEELIISGVAVTGSGPMDEVTALTTQLLENAKKGMRAAASHPELDVVWDVRRDASISQVECWTAHAQTRDKQVMFFQAAVVRPGGVLLITFEAPNGLEHHEVLMQLLNSVRPLGTN